MLGIPGLLGEIRGTTHLPHFPQFIAHFLVQFPIVMHLGVHNRKPDSPERAIPNCQGNGYSSLVTWIRWMASYSSLSTGWFRWSRLNRLSELNRSSSFRGPFGHARLPFPSGPSCRGPFPSASFRGPCRFPAELEWSAGRVRSVESGHPAPAAVPKLLPRRPRQRQGRKPPRGSFDRSYSSFSPYG